MNNINKSNKKMKKTKKCKLKIGQKVKGHVLEKDRDLKRVLIVENVQNCFFKGGSMGFMSKGKREEQELIKKINFLINLEEKSIKYKNAGLSGKKTKKGGLLSKIVQEDNSLFQTNSRKKYYYDIIVFSCTTNPPDHYIFSSHHYLRDSKMYKPYVETEGKRSKTYRGKDKFQGREEIVLLPDHALTDGSDFHMEGNKKLIGIDFHPDLDISSLYRPFDNKHRSVFLNKQHYHNRGFIIHKGTTKKGCRSSFFHSDMKTTGLNKFLKCNNIVDLTVCGMGREHSIYLTLMDSLSCKNIKIRSIVSDATKNLGIEIPPQMYPKDVEKELKSKKNEDFIDISKFFKLLKNNGILPITIEILVDITKSEKIFDKQEKMGELQGSIASLENFFSKGLEKPPDDNVLERSKRNNKIGGTNRFSALFT